MLSYSNDKIGKIINNIATEYVLILFIFFPFFNTDMYFNLLQDRTVFFRSATIAFFILISIFFAIYIFLYIKDMNDTFMPAKDTINSIFQSIRSRLTITDLFVLILIISLFVSTFLSDYRNEALTGSLGRNQGLYTWICYILCYLIVSKAYKPKEVHIDMFLAVGAITALWGIFDYIGLDIFKWSALIKEEQRDMFTSSFGNINTYTEMMGIYAAACSAYLCYSNESNSIKKSVLILLCLFILFVALITGQSDNAIISIALIFVAGPYFLYKKKDGLSLYFLMISIFFFAMWTSSVLTSSFQSPFTGYNKGMLLTICRYKNMMFFISLAFFLGSVLFYKIKRNTIGKAVITLWTILMITAAATFIAIFYLVNFNGYDLKNNILMKLFYFDDYWGTYRGFIWKRAVSYFNDFPILNKMFGSGLETFAVLTNMHDYNEMLTICGQVFDSPHNEFLQYLVTTGILGSVSYYGMVISAIVKGLNKTDIIRKIFSFVVLVYTFVSFVNISVPLVVPFLIISVGISSKKNVNEQISVNIL